MRISLDNIGRGDLKKNTVTDSTLRIGLAVIGKRMQIIASYAVLRLQFQPPYKKCLSIKDEVLNSLYYFSSSLRNNEQADYHKQNSPSIQPLIGLVLNGTTVVLSIV